MKGWLTQGEVKSGFEPEVLDWGAETILFELSCSFVRVCVGGRAIIAAAASSPQPPSPEFCFNRLNWKSHFISEEMNGWDLCGVGRQRRLNYRAAQCGRRLWALTRCPDTTWSLRGRLFSGGGHLLPETTAKSDSRMRFQIIPGNLKLKRHHKIKKYT